MTPAAPTLAPETTPFNPAAPEAEQIAWSAGLALSNPPENFDTPLADGRTPRQIATDTYRSYYEHRTGKGLQPFPTIQRQATKQRDEEFRKAYSGLDQLEQNLRPEQYQQLDIASKDAPDPAEYKARAINANFLEAVTGRKIDPADFSTVRDAYADQVLGLKGPVTDKTFYETVRTRHQEDQQAAAAFSTHLEGILSKRLATIGKVETGTPTPTNAEIKGFDRPVPRSLEYKPDLAERDAFLATVPERLRENYRQQWNDSNRELTRLFRTHAPLVEQIVRSVEQTATGQFGDQEKIIWDDATKWADSLPQNPKDRALVLTMLGNALDNLPPDTRSTGIRIASAAARGVNLAIDTNKQALIAEGRQTFGKLSEGTDVLKQDTADFLTRRRELLDVLQGNGLKLSNVADNIIEKSALAAASSAWMIPASLNPIGQVAIVQSMTGQSVQDQAVKNPTAPESVRTNMAFASGLAQGALEILSDTTGVKILMGKLPTFTSLLNKTGLTNPVARGILGAAGGYAATTGIEYTEEALQGATDQYFQSLAADLTANNPNIDWGNYFKQWLTVAGPEQRETLLAVSAFGMIAGAGAGFHHFKNGSAIQNDKRLMRAIGFDETQIRDVITTEDPQAAAQKAAAYFDLAQARAKDPAEAAHQENLRKKYIATLRAQNEALQAAGLPRVIKERNDFTEQDQFVFIDPADNSRKTFDTEEQALEAFGNWKSTQDEANLDTIRTEAENHYLDHLTSEGQQGENIDVQRIDKTRSLATVQSELQTQQQTAEADLRKASNLQQERRAKEQLSAIQQKLAWLNSRIKVFLFDEGIPAAKAGEALKSARILGETFATKVMDRIAGYTVRLYRGADLATIAEEFSEANIRDAIDNGFVDPEILLDNIRRYESTSGNAVIDPAYEWDPENPIPVLEGFSKLARGYMLSQVRAGLLPPTVARWIEMQTALQAATIEAGTAFAADIKTAAELRAAITAGQLPGRLEAQIKDAIGLDPAAQERRLQKQMEEQLAAEAMDGFPEIQDEARARLPHPETLRENSHPLYGEIRRLWDSLKKPTKRRTKAGKAIDRTNEANAYFLPIGEMVDLDDVRQSLNERGFAFDTITDLIDALDASISYGKPFYGTASAMEEGASSYSIETPGPLPTTASSYSISLTALHNLSEENLKFADQMGGLAVPSIAVVPSGNVIDGFGEITLIGGRPLADPSANPVFDADAYTARFPSPEWKKVPMKLAQAVVDRFRPFTKKGLDKGWNLIDAIWDNAVNRPDPEKSISQLKRIPSAKAAFLSLVNGIDIEPIQQPARIDVTGVDHPIFQKYLKDEWNGGLPRLDFNDTAGRKKLTDKLLEAEDAALRERYANITGKDLKFLLESARKRSLDSLDENGLLPYNFEIRLHRAIEKVGTMELDQDATNQRIDDALAGREEEFYQWIEDQIRPMFGEPRLKIGGKFEPYTLSNIVRAMTSGKIAGSEKTMTFSEGQIRAMNAHRFRGLEEMRNYAESFIQTEEQVKQNREELSKRLAKWREDMVSHYRYKSAWDALDNSMEALGRFLKGPRTPARMASSLRAMDFEGVPSNLIKEAMEIGNLFMNAPVPYFESKPQRVVTLDEFNAAVVPQSASQETFDILAKHGIAFEIVPDNQSRDYTARRDALTKAIKATEGVSSFSLTTRGVLSLDAAIAKRMTRGPDERADFFEKLRNRLAATVLQLREAKRNVAIDATEAERERNRIQDALAEARAIIDALPAEARGRVPFNVADILEATTERGQINALIRLIDKADEALETVLLKEYRDAFEILLDLAKPDLRQNKQIRGRLTPATQKLVGKIYEATILSPEELAARLVANQSAIDALEASTPATPEEIKAAQEQLIEDTQDQTILETFGAFSRLDAAGTARAYEQLQSIYATGRTARRILDEARKAEIDAKKRELLDSLPIVTSDRHTKRVADKGWKDFLESFRLGMSSFHQVMETLFPKSTVARDFQEQVRKADRAFVRAKLDAKERWDAFTFGVWNLTGRSRSRQRNQILAELSTLREDWNIQLAEGISFATEKLTEEQADAILKGTMKTGWETDPIAMTSLAQALADFRMQRLKAQNEDKRFTATVIRFQRLKGRGTPAPFVASDMQALYYLQLWDQEQYRPALDKHGLTAEVMDKIRLKLSPKAADIADFLRDEYDAEWDRLNPVYRAIYGLDMPRIRNYAPGLFEHLDAKGPGTDSTIDPTGQPAAVNAMSAGFTKARTHHMARPRLTNAMSAYWSHLEATEYFIAYAEILRDARQIFRNPELRRRIEGIHGTSVAKLFSQWLDALEVDGNFRAVELESLSRIAHNVLATQSAAGLAYNIGVLLKQASASFGFLMEMPTRDALAGIALAFRNPSTLRHVWNSESVQQRIRSGISPEDRKLLDAAKASPSLIMELLEIGRLPIAYADAAFTTLSASVAYAFHHNQAIKAGLSPTAAETTALQAADRVITRTAQPATTQDKSMAEITAKTWGKFFFMFKSDPRQKLAIVAQALADIRDGKPGARAAATRKALFGWVFYGLANEVLTDVWAAMSRDDDDPERWAWNDYLAAMIAGPVNAIPILGQTLEYIDRGLIGTKAYVNSPNPVDAITRVPATASKLAKQMAEDDIQVNDVLTASQQLTSAFAAAAGAIDPRFAIVPAALRVTRDTFGLATNFSHLFTEPTADDTRLEIVREFAAQDKTTRTGTKERNDKLAADLLKLPAPERAKAITKLDKDTRTAITRRLRAAEMTSSEAALARLSADTRKAAIEKLAATMTPQEKTAFIDRLRHLGLAD